MKTLTQHFSLSLSNMCNSKKMLYARKSYCFHLHCLEFDDPLLLDHHFHHCVVLFVIIVFSSLLQSTKQSSLLDDDNQNNSSLESLSALWKTFLSPKIG